MKKSLFEGLLITLALHFGVMPEMSAAESISIATRYIEPGESKALVVNLDNEVDNYGFQADISLPKGLEFVVENGSPVVELSSRASSRYSIVTNLLNLDSLRIGAFSTTHSPIVGNSGTIMLVKVVADDEFEGGNLSITNIHLVGENDRDVVLPDYKLNIRNQAINLCYIPDFSVGVSKTKTVSLMLENETHFTAFQTDLYLPEGLSIVDDSFRLTTRTANHSIATKSFSDGRTRLICFSTDNKAISSSAGAVVEFDIRANNDEEGVHSIELKNQIFSTLSAEDNILPNSITDVRVSRILVSEIILSEIKVALGDDDSIQIYANVIPSDATNTEIIWSSSDESVATVFNGLVVGHKAGTAIIRAEAADGSGVFAECEVEVSPNSGISSVGTEGISVSTEPYVVTVYGINEDDVIHLYDISGRMHYSGCGPCIEVAQSGVYILVVNNKTFKIQL